MGIGIKTSIGIFIASWLSVSFAQESDWLLVDTGARALAVMRGDRELRRFDDISIGRAGTTDHRRAGDQATPVGNYRITSIRRGDRTAYHVFFALDYPSIADAEAAFEMGDIDRAQLEAVRNAHQRAVQPPASTPLGGGIGIHGIGKGDPRIHAAFNWTDGCVALLNEEVEELAKWVIPGMTVVIR